MNHFWEALLVVFITLKVTGLIDWSWWFVLLPLWIPLGIAAVGLVLYLFCDYMHKRSLASKS